MFNYLLMILEKDMTKLEKLKIYSIQHETFQLKK